MSSASSAPEPPAARAAVDAAELRAVRAELATIRGELGQVLPQTCQDDAQLLAYVPTNLQVRAEADLSRLVVALSSASLPRRAQ